MATSVEASDRVPSIRGNSQTAAALAALAAAWLAAGSTGLLAHSLRHALTWAALAAVLVAGWPGLRRSRHSFADAALLLAAVLAAVVLSASPLPAVNALAAVVLPATLAGIAARRADATSPDPAAPPSPGPRILMLASTAAAVLALYRIACTSIPLAWLAADRVGAAVGAAGGLVVGAPLNVGATFAGLDFLVPMIAFYAGWLWMSPPPRWPRAIVAGAFLAAGHLAYLAAVAWAPALLAALPPAPPAPTPALTWNLAPWTFSEALKTLLPWNLPALAGLIHIVIAAFLLAHLRRVGLSAPRTCPLAAAPVGRWLRPAAWALAAAAALALPVLTNLSTGRASLAGKKIVAYKRGFLNWEKPKHGPSNMDYGHYSIGMYGMLPIFVEQMGGEMYFTEDCRTMRRPRWPLKIHPRVDGISELEEESEGEPLANADVLVMMYPNTAWTGEQLQRMHTFVRDGKSLLVFGEHTIMEFDGRARFNDVLELFAEDSADIPRPLAQAADLVKAWEDRRRAPGEKLSEETAARVRGILDELTRQYGRAGLTVDDLGSASKEPQLRQLIERVHRPWQQESPMRVLFDAGQFVVGGWLQTYEALAHPATSGSLDDRNQFGVVIGASMEIRSPARPVLIGRYGWGDVGDPGSPQAMLGNIKYDPGEHLGDVVLAAEQPYGRGRVFAFGDTSSITNGITIGAHAFNSRLLTYLANASGVGNPQGPWRQGLAAVTGLLLLASLLWQWHPWRTAGAALLLAGGLTFCAGASYQTTLTLPDGNAARPAANAPAISNRLAYIDAGHLGLYSGESWRDDGIMGLCLNLMRNGYETLLLPRETDGPAGGLFNADLFRRRLERAGLYVVIAPQREFSPAEREIVRDFVDRGGSLIVTVGYPEAGPAASLLKEFDFALSNPHAGPDDLPPQTWGHFKSPFVPNGTYMAHVRLHAGWRVWDTSGKRPAQPGAATAIAYGPGGTEDNPMAAILLRAVGKGKVVVVGDTGFAMNKNLEFEGGQPFDGMRENADFWHWLVTSRLPDRPGFLPSPPPPPPPATPDPAPAPAAEDAKEANP